MEHIVLLINSLNDILRHMDSKQKIYKYITNVSFTMPFYHDNKNKICIVSVEDINFFDRFDLM
jgi:hypothetical protein